MIKKEQPYYNVDYLSKILILHKERKYKKAFEQYKIYLENYPLDLTANVNFANLLVKLGYLEEAKNILEKLKSFSNSLEPYQIFINHIFLEILCAEGKYQEAYLYLKDHPELSITDCALFTIKKHANIKIDEKNSQEKYFFQQISNYDENKFLEHVQKHKLEFDSKQVSFFRENFSIEEVCNQIKRMIPNDKRIIHSIEADRYFFKYDNCGYKKDKNTDYFTVVVLPNTNNLITMYPISFDEVVDFIDLNPCFKKEEQEYTRTKRRSQIEKFNQKYGN